MVKRIACFLVILCILIGIASGCQQASTGIPETPTFPEEINTVPLLGVDVSIYTGEVPVSTWQQMKQAGWEFVIVGAWHGRSQNTYAQQQLSEARQANMKVAAYLLLNFDNVDQSGGWQVEQALAAIGDQKSYLSFMAIDVELPDGWAKTVDVNQRIQQAIDRVTQAGLRPIIYTSRGEWQKVTADTDAFASLPLWDARWDAAADLNTNWVSYGGWGARVGKQYSGNATLFDKNVDLNVFEATMFSTSTPDSMPPEQSDLPSISGRILVLSGQGPVKRPEIRGLNLWAVDPDTGDKTPLPDSVWNTDKTITISLSDFGTSWSANGDRVASFWGPQQTWDEMREIETGGVNSIFIINLNNFAGMCIQLDSPVTEVLSTPCWSPDGNKLAFSSWWPNNGLHVVNINSSQVTHILQDTEVYDFEWSPDSTKFVISGKTQYSSAGLFIIDSDGGNREDLGVFGFSPSWSPDGSKIAFATTKDGISTENLCVLNLHTHMAEELFAESDKYPYNSGQVSHILQVVWSPDSTNIAFGTSKVVRVGEGYNEIFGGIYIINSDGSNLRNLVREDELHAAIPWLAQVESLPEEIHDSMIIQNVLVAWIFTD